MHSRGTDLDARSASAKESRCNRYRSRCAMRAELEHSANLLLDDPNPSVARRSELCRFTGVRDARSVRHAKTDFNVMHVRAAL
jgi:hypothetical protein